MPVVVNMWVPNFRMYSHVIWTAPCKIFKKWSAVETLSFLKKIQDQFPSSFVDSMPKYFCSWCNIWGVMVECSCPGTSDLFMCQYIWPKLHCFWVLPYNRRLHLPHVAQSKFLYTWLNTVQLAPLSLWPHNTYVLFCGSLFLVATIHGWPHIRA